MDREVFDRVLAGARDVQDYLWGEAVARTYSDETWLNILQKRMDRLRALDPTLKHAHVEKRKRVLQLAAVSLAWLEQMGPLGPQPDHVSDSAAGLAAEVRADMPAKA